MHVGGLRQRALLALLLCHANQVVSRDELIEELLADQPAGAAVRLLRVQISRLRQVLADGDGPPRLVARPPGDCFVGFSHPLIGQSVAPIVES